MRILLLTNLYPPQELGGYGRSMADFAWGLASRGHQILVLTSDSSYLGDSSTKGTSGETICRKLILCGSYQGGVNLHKDPQVIRNIEWINNKTIEKLLLKEGPFDAALVGNLDLLSNNPLNYLLSAKIPVIHHIGFVNPPFTADHMPKSAIYTLVAASAAVGKSMEQAGLMNNTKKTIPIVYPGVRTDLFGDSISERALPQPLNGKSLAGMLGTTSNPIKLCYAGLLMSSKGAHTLISALLLLRKLNIKFQVNIAGNSFQQDYCNHLKDQLKKNNIDSVNFVGQLNRPALARFFRLHHICVFPSIYPEAFGIVGAEAMASGIALISSGVGGAAELFENNVSGLLFEPNEPNSLAEKILNLCKQPQNLNQIAKAGMARATASLSVYESAKKLELIASELIATKKSLC